MSAISEIDQKNFSDMSTIENAIWRLWTFGGQNFIAEEAAEELSALRAESESRRVALKQKAEELRREWTRAENAEAALEEAKAYMAIYANEDNWASHDGVMYLRTLSTPWGNAKEFLRRHGGPK